MCYPSGKLEGKYAEGWQSQHIASCSGHRLYIHIYTLVQLVSVSARVAHPLPPVYVKCSCQDRC